MKSNIVAKIKLAKDNAQSLKNYYIIMILVAGDIKDENETDKELEQLSKLPVSVAIVGIGKGPFSKLIKFCNQGKRPYRRNFEFVQYGKDMPESIFNQLDTQFNTFIKKDRQGLKEY